MKKIILYITLIFTAVFLVSCGGANRDDVLRVGMDLSYPPFEVFNIETRKAEGISADVAYELGKYLGKEVQIVNIDFGMLIQSLEDKTIDVAISSMSITEERKQLVSFSEPYFYFKIITLLNKDYANNHGLTEESTYLDLLDSPDTRYVGMAKQVSLTIPQSYGKNVSTQTNIQTAILDVAQGRADALLMSAGPVIGGYKAHLEHTLILWDAFEASPIGMAVNKGNTELLNQINTFLSTAHDDGGLYDILRDKWNDTLFEDLGEQGMDFYIYE